MPVSHQSYNHLAVRFSAGVRPWSRLQTKLHTSCGFSTNLRRLYDARTIVLCSWAGLSQGGLQICKTCHKWGHASVLRTALVVVRFTAFLLQPCNKAQGHCRIIVQQSSGIRGRNMLVRPVTIAVRNLASLGAALQRPCVSCHSLASSLDHTRNARKIYMSKILFLSLRPLGVLRCCPQHCKTAAWNLLFVIVERCTATVPLVWNRLYRGCTKLFCCLYAWQENENIQMKINECKWYCWSAISATVLALVVLNQDFILFWKHWRSRSAGFWWS